MRGPALSLQPAGAPLAPVLDSTLATFPLISLDGNRTIYEVVFRATDSAGLEGKKVIQILIAP